MLLSVNGYSLHLATMKYIIIVVDQNITNSIVDNTGRIKQLPFCVAFLCRTLFCVVTLGRGRHNSGGFGAVCHFCHKQNKLIGKRAFDSPGYGGHFTSNKQLGISIVYCVVSA